MGRIGGDAMVRPAPAAFKATQILDFLIAHPSQSFTLSQIARANDMNVATARTVLAVLTDAGYLVHQRSNRSFAIGPLLVAAGAAALERYPAVDIARNEMARVSTEFDVELLLTVAAGDDIVAVARTGRPHPRGIDIGRRVPLVPPLGAVFIAWSSEEEMEHWVDRAGQGHSTEMDRYRRILESTASRGYSVALRVPGADDVVADAIAAVADHPGDRGGFQQAVSNLSRVDYHLEDLDHDGPFRVLMIAAPVFDADGRTLLAISLLDVPSPLSATEVVEWGSRLRDIGLGVTRATRGESPGVVRSTAQQRAKNRN
jgi:DNA-binding IclR family transcriptional regulator